MPIQPTYTTWRPPTYPPRTVPPAPPDTTSPASTTVAPAGLGITPGVRSALTFGGATMAGAAIAGFAKGRTAGAIGAVALTAVHNAYYALQSTNTADKALCFLPTAVTAAAAGIGYLIAGPVGALVGALLPAAPHAVWYGYRALGVIFDQFT